MIKKSKNILLAVTGLSPQVVTETIYALYKEGKTIDEVQIITTKTGKDQAWLRLGLEREGQVSHLTQLQKDYNLPPIHFNETSIHIVPDANGYDVDDARTKSDQDALADYITNKVRELTEDNDTCIFASLAGGRKTMTFFLGYAMSLFGRTQDSLSHVLVSKEYETSNDFYYPTPRSKMIKNKENIVYDAKNAIVELIDLPFIRMRDEMPERVVKQGISYTQTVNAINKSHQEPKLIIDIPNRKVIASGEEVKMPNAQMAFYIWMAQRAASDCLGLPLPSEPVGDNNMAEKKYGNEYLDAYHLIAPNVTKASEAMKSDGGMTKKYFSEKKTLVNKTLRKTLGSKLASSYIIEDVGSDKYKLFGLMTPKNNIEIVYGNINVSVSKFDKIMHQTHSQYK